MAQMIEEDNEFPSFPTSESTATTASGGAGKVIATIIVIVIILGGILWTIARFTDAKIPFFNFAKPEAASEWSAIFLSNSQVYFGKIKNTTSRDLVLTDIYYLQVVSQQLQRSQETVVTEDANGQKQELTLVKLGNELHGPTDEMVINRDQILLTEKLRGDSKVVQSINEYLKQANNK